MEMKQFLKFWNRSQNFQCFFELPSPKKSVFEWKNSKNAKHLKTKTLILIPSQGLIYPYVKMCFWGLIYPYVKIFSWGLIYQGLHHEGLLYNYGQELLSRSDLSLWSRSTVKSDLPLCAMQLLTYPHFYLVLP